MNVFLGRRIGPSVASVSPTSAQETTRCESEPYRWLEMARGRTSWTCMWLNVRDLVRISVFQVDSMLRNQTV